MADGHPDKIDGKGGIYSLLFGGMFWPVARIAQGSGDDRHLVSPGYLLSD
jgi:hypothetical protein